MFTKCLRHSKLVPAERRDASASGNDIALQVSNVCEERASHEPQRRLFMSEFFYEPVKNNT